ncbi:polysaccharide deacetylase family protein [Roseivivax isoporae]|uniref:Chitooligosaccharide deacetylase n=1 Tax=Roseivivax isoporae LMG 25204 TaxID=1449351 RepID=X7FBA2_9RHOB|nr:polysaccharide deacetylase family protein [Roseivivax isoporae]ETX30040.1 oligosaccharide deacetylase [Roseivivax isoporae LMG 25204]
MPDAPQDPAPAEPRYLARGRKTVWITLDDGPHPAHTPTILRALDAHGVRAVFFVIGRNARAHPGLLAEMAGAGHLVGNHTWTHPNLARQPAATIRDELARTRDAIADHPGGTTLFRPPYGAHNATVDRVAAEMGYRTILWSVDTLDWNRAYKPDKWVQHGLDQVRARTESVVIAHDIHKTTAAHFDAFLGRIRGLPGTGFGAPTEI